MTLLGKYVGRAGCRLLRGSERLALRALLPVDARHGSQGQFQRVGAVAGVPQCGQREVELMGQGEAGQRQADAFGLILIIAKNILEVMITGNVLNVQL